jgi:hypothetical protein
LSDHKTKPDGASRRKFLGDILRILVVGAGTGGVVALAKKSGETCINQSICRTCGVNVSCGLPQALSFRQVESEIGLQKRPGGTPDAT